MVNRKRLLCTPTGALAALLVGLTLPTAHASERRFAYTYQTAILNPGDIELEPQVTWRYLRERFYSRLEGRIEVELGVTGWLQTAFYFNFRSINQDRGDGAGAASESRFSGVSSEWKMRLSDSVADAIGSAVYLELSGGPEEVGLEAKILLDKRSGPFLFALNLVGEYEWELETFGVNGEAALDADAGAAYFVTHHVAAGVEARSHTELSGEGVETSTLFAGPAISYSTERWWVVATIQAQLPAPYVRQRAGSPVAPDLNGHEWITSRLVFGFHL